MVWACRKNGWVSYFQKGVDGGSKWRAGTRETEVMLNGWCQGGLGQQRNDGGGCASMREGSERVECPGTYVTEWFSRGHFCFALCSCVPPSRALVVITWRWVECAWDKLWKGRNYWISRHICQVYGLRSVCWLSVCWLDMTTPRVGGRKSWYIIINNNTFTVKSCELSIGNNENKQIYCL